MNIQQYGMLKVLYYSQAFETTFTHYLKVGPTFNILFHDKPNNKNNIHILIPSFIGTNSGQWHFFHI